MVDVRNRKCFCGKSQPSFGMSGDKATHMGNLVSSVTAERVDEAMRSIVAGMKNFEPFRVHLLGCPWFHVISELASRAQRLESVLSMLQHRGVEQYCARNRRTLLESDAQEYAAELEAFVMAQATFLKDLKEKLR